MRQRTDYPLPPASIHWPRPFDERFLYAPPERRTPRRAPPRRLPSPYPMRAAAAATLIGSGASSSSTVTTSSGTTTGGANTVFAVAIAWDASVTISSVSDSKSNSYTAQGSIQADGNGGNLRWYTCAAGTGGTSHTVTVNFSGTAYPSISFYEFTGVDTTLQQASQGQDSGGQPFTITTGAMPSGNWILLAACSNNTGSTGAYTANSSTPTMTLLHSEGDVSNYWTHGVGRMTSSGTGTVTPSFNRSGTAGGTSALSFIVFSESSGVSITPSAGTLTVTGFAPTVAASGGTSISPSAGTLTVTGHAPTLGLGISPGTGTLTLTGFAPTTGQNVAPGVGTLTVTGHAPTLDLGIRPGVGTLTLTGYEPTLTLTLPAPAPGVLVLTGHQPTVSVGANISTGVGTLTVTGFAPALDLGIRPDVGTLSLAGAVPTLSTGITPDAGALLVTGYAPTAAASANSNITPDAGTLSVTGFAPSLGLTITTGAGALVVNGHAPTLGDEINITTQVGVLETAGHAPTLGLAITPAAGVLVLGGHAPVLSLGITPDAGQIIVAGHVPTVEAAANIAINPLTGALVITGYEPSVAATGQPQTGELVLTGHAPTVEVSGEDIATDPKLIARPNVRIEGFGKRKPTPKPTPAPAQITNMHPPVPRPLAGGLLAALGAVPPEPGQLALIAAPARATPAPTATPQPVLVPSAAPAPRQAATAAPVALVAPVYAPLPAAPAPVPVVAGITPEQMTVLLQRMDALSETVSSRLVETNQALQADIERVTQLLEAERDARLAREKRELNEARAKEITARLLGGG